MINHANIVIYLGIGISVFILFGALQQGARGHFAHIFYWGLIAITGLLSIYFPDGYFLLIIFIVPGLRIYIRNWLGHSHKSSEIIAFVPLILIIIGLVVYFNWDFYFLSAYILIESIFLVRYLHRAFRSKGIDLLNRPGKRITLTVILVGLNLSMLMIMLPGTLFGMGDIFVINYLLVTLLGMVIYAGVPDAYKPLFSLPKYARSSLDEKEKYRILTEIDKQILQHRFHLNPNASLKGLAKLVHGNEHQVSQVINESKQLTFFELMAQHRIREGKKILGDPKYDHFKIEQIAEEVGYLSKSAFNTSFKKITGFTPSEYRTKDVRNHKIERLSDDHVTQKPELESTFVQLNYWIIMLSGFFKIYFRNQLRNKSFFAINMIGLIVGLTSTLLIFVFIRHELSFDRFHADAENIYRVTWMTENPQTRTPHPLAQAMVKDFSQVESGVSLSPVYGPGLTLQSIYIRNSENNIMFQEPDVFLVDSTFFDVFDFKLISGKTDDALDDVGDIVITQQLAEKYFGSQDPLGKSLEIVEYDFRGTVSGVMENPPVNSHFHPQLMISYVTRKSREPGHFWFEWGDFGHFNYVRLGDGADPEKIVESFPEWLAGYIELSPDQIEDMKSRQYYLDLQPITDIHLHSGLRWELEANNNIVYIYILIAAIVFLVVIASINFINLSTARAFERSKEVGIRRTLGAHKSAVSFQFVSEAVLTCLLALTTAFLLSFLLFGEFNQLIGKQIPVVKLFDYDVILFSLSMTLVVGAVTGMYPAIFVTRIKPVVILRGKFINQASGSLIRKALIGIQFVVSSVMIFGSLVILDQIEFMENKALGFELDQIVVLELHSTDEVNRLRSIKSDIGNIPGVVGTAGISNLPGAQFNQNEIFPVGQLDDEVSCSELRVDFDALQLLGLNLIKGRWFDPTMLQDSAGSNFIINEAAFDQLNATLEDPMATKIVWNEEPTPREGNIVGVVENFHYKSLHRAIQPMVINVRPTSINYLLVKINAGTGIANVLDRIEEVHRKFDDQFEFDFFFLDQLIQDQYVSERKVFDVFNLFASLALVLAAMGLLGLAYLVVTQRTREIGIRKVMGARVTDILMMENKAFLKIIVVSILIGLPVSYLLMQQWLNSFAYRTELSVQPFFVTILLLLLVSVFSVTLAVMRTILKNPSVALRYE